MNISKYFRINQLDLIKGFIMSIIMSVVTLLGVSLSTGDFPSLKALEKIGLISVGAGVSYVGKQFLTDENGSFLGITPKINPPAETFSKN